MHTPLETTAQQYFARHYARTIDDLLAPIAQSPPAGMDLRGNGVFRAIQEARRQDDASLPRGPWEHELKQADWDEVGRIAVEALAAKSKDLRLAGWLLEAEINRRGFEGIAPCLTLMQALCERYWEHLHPRGEDADLEYRTNVIHWANEKLLPALRLVPITHTGRERELHWADWEQANRLEQLRAAHGSNAENVDGVTLLEFASAMASTPVERHAALYAWLADALAAAERLSQTLNALCGAEAPGLGALTGLLEQIQTLIATELRKRGRQPGAPEETPAPQAGETEMPAPVSGGALCDRAAAYARLAEAADYLMRIEPHSPTPYLVKRAIAWGNLNTAELYRELFVECGGVLNIFDLLGIRQAPPRKE